MQDKVEWISSTALNQYLDCPRKWYLTYVRGHKTQVSKPMAVGTVTHAILEWYLTKGYWPNESGVRSMAGNYQPPREALEAFPTIFKDALTMAQCVPEDWLVGVPEVALEDWNLTLGGVKLRGYIDAFLPERLLVRGYKPRGSFRYMPRLPSEFRENIQLCLYAAATRQQYGWDSVTIQHGNILRVDKGGPKFVEAGITLDGWFLDEVWEHLDTVVVPDMMAGLAHGKEAYHEEQEACYKYGACQFITRCNRASYDCDFLDGEAMRILSPEAPEDILPVDFPDKPLGVLGIASNVEASLHASFACLGDLDSFLRSGEDLTKFKGIGKATAARIEAMMVSLRPDCEGGDQ